MKNHSIHGDMEANGNLLGFPKSVSDDTYYNFRKLRTSKIFSIFNICLFVCMFFVLVLSALSSPENSIEHLYPILVFLIVGVSVVVIMLTYEFAKYKEMQKSQDEKYHMLETTVNQMQNTYIAKMDESKKNIEAIAMVLKYFITHDIMCKECKSKPKKQSRELFLM